MAQVRINRELLYDVLQSVKAYHHGCQVCRPGERDCVESQRILRLEGLLERSVDE